VGVQGEISEALLRCEDEPIRVPGSVQQHGFFLLVDGLFEKVLVASENAERFLNLPMKLILGAQVDAIVGRELNLVLGALRSPIRGSQQKELHALVTYLGAFRIGDEQFSVMTHSIGSNRALEFEQQDRLVGPEMMNAVITNFVATLERLENEQDLCDALAEQIAELTEFDRVMLYSFNEEGHGTVLSEVNNGRLPRYLGLRFPASDIPKQARELYVLNTTRIIPNAAYEPSPLAGATTRQVSQLDLSLSVLRSVSPIHLQYMRNMGTAASMSVSIVLGGKLWGLVSCHTTEPKTVPYLIRSACDMLTKMAVTRLATFQASARLKELVHFHQAQRDLLTILASEQNYLAALTGQSARLMTIANASGAAVLVDGKFSSAGMVPDGDALERLSKWLDEDENREIFASSYLESVLPWTESIRGVASGLMAVRISSVRRRYVLWFRPEVVSTVRWAGEPVKQVTADMQLTPRASFNQWKEIVHGRSEPWTLTEIESAADFRTALITVGLHRAEEAIELGEARFQRLTQALPVKVFTADDSGRLTYVNERWLESGLNPSGLWFEQVLLRQEDAEMSLRLWQECVATGKNFEAEVRLAEVRRPGGENGAERWNFARVVPFQRAGAKRAGWIGTFVDLTESRERELAMRMTEKLALTGRMTSVIAHEINNPLEAITNLMYLLRGEVTANDAAVDYIDQVESELERISGVTKQTLRWNRETGKPESFDLRLLVDEVLRLFAGKIRNKQIDVRQVGGVADGTPIAGWGVVGQIRQILANLISNAIDAVPMHGGIVIRLLARDGETGFSVEDNGSGMTKAMQSRLFEPFFSTKGDLGNGLGLYISHEIIVRHKGRIEVESDEAKGTTMTVWFPREMKLTDGALS
jgi:light-regulated signal transduction histidine kinase (bacteriophytochrome)